MPVRPPVNLRELFSGIRDKDKIKKYGEIFKEYLKDARVKIRDLAKRYGMMHTTVKYFLTERILPLGSHAPFLIHPHNLGLSIHRFTIETRAEDFVGALASIEGNDLVRVLWSEGNKIFAFVVGQEGDIEEFVNRLKTTYGVEYFDHSEIQLHKFDQLIPPSVIDRFVEAMSHDMD